MKQHNSPRVARRSPRAVALAVASAAIAAGCAGPAAAPNLDREVQAMMKSSFRAQGIATLDRLDQDLGQAACSTDKPPSEAVAKQIEAQSMATIQWPEDGIYLGDWKAGETLAQSGRGMTWTDASADPKGNGGNCYNCHQMDRAEVSYGTIGPSLWNYGKVRGVKSVTDPSSAAVIQYTWGKLWNSKAYAACSNMPRFGHKQLLTKGQIRDLMALLLDPRSPVNQ